MRVPGGGGGGGGRSRDTGAAASCGGRRSSEGKGKEGPLFLSPSLRRYFSGEGREEKRRKRKRKEGEKTTHMPSPPLHSDAGARPKSKQGGQPKDKKPKKVR